MVSFLKEGWQLTHQKRIGRTISRDKTTLLHDELSLLSLFFLISPGRMIPSSKINAWAARLQTAHAGSSFASSRGRLAALSPGLSVSPPRVPRGADSGGGAQGGWPETQGRPALAPTHPATPQPLCALARGSSAHRRRRAGWGGRWCQLAGPNVPPTPHMSCSDSSPRQL